MRVFDKVANIKVNDNTYNLLDTVERETFNTEYNETRRLDGILLANKTNLATAITNKGVTTSPNDSLLQFAENISNIEAGDKPSKGLMKSIKAYTENGLTSSNSIRYYYPFVGRTGSGMGSLSFSKGSGGYYFSDNNIEFSDCIAITRLVKSRASLTCTALFLNCYITIHAISISNSVKLCYGVNKERKEFNIPDGISKTDYYLKIDLKKNEDNNFLINVYFANADIDGKPTEFILSDFVIYSGEQTPAPRTELYLSVLGISPEFSSYTYLNEPDPASTGEKLTLRYKNYIKETCLALKNSEGIYKVALGASTIYPY